MAKYNERILDRSVWITATPTPLALTLPFYIMEAGHFWAENDYHVQRKKHESFLMLYTITGCGMVKSPEIESPLLPGYAVIIDCNKPHEYYSLQGSWEFMWIHMNGTAIQPLFHALYQDTVRTIDTNKLGDMEYKLAMLMECSKANDIAGSIQVSAMIHTMFHALFTCAIENENSGKQKKHLDDIRTVVDFIQSHYSEAITVDDMIQDIHISKYHFIRIFSRVMGATPYSYLMNYRINMSKKFLHSTDMPVSEIAEKCGFLDTSNFITQFKKHTGQRPLQYRNDFVGASVKMCYTKYPRRKELGDAVTKEEGC